jgi:hypothetical protein
MSARIISVISTWWENKGGNFKESVGKRPYGVSVATSVLYIQHLPPRALSCKQTHLVRRNFVNSGKDSKRSPKFARYPIIEQNEFSIWGKKGESPRAFELVKPDALVEVAVIQHNRTVSTTTCRVGGNQSNSKNDTSSARPLHIHSLISPCDYDALSPLPMTRSLFRASLSSGLPDK